MREQTLLMILALYLAPVQVRVEGRCLDLQSSESALTIRIRPGAVQSTDAKAYSSALIAENKFIDKGRLEILVGAGKLFPQGLG